MKKLLPFLLLLAACGAPADPWPTMPHEPPCDSGAAGAPDAPPPEQVCTILTSGMIVTTDGAQPVQIDGSLAMAEMCAPQYQVHESCPLPFPAPRPDCAPELGLRGVAIAGWCCPSL